MVHKAAAPPFWHMVHRGPAKLGWPHLKIGPDFEKHPQIPQPTIPTSESEAHNGGLQLGVLPKAAR